MTTIKSQKLVGLLNSVFNNKLYNQELNTIMNKFSLTFEDIKHAFLDYNLDVFSHDNNIYNNHAIRVVLYIHNLIEGSWHIDRQKAVCELIAQAKPQKAVDLGFGVPSRYVRQLVQDKSFSLTLCDYQQAALDFADSILSIWSSSWQNAITLRLENMEQVSSCVGDYDLYIALHSLEHLNNPKECLCNYVRLSRADSLFIIEIPIGPITPEHTIAWHSIAEAQEWITQCGLKIIDDRMTYVNKNIDLFAEAHDFNYGGYLILCQKNRN
jgi:hypothetical protein